MDPNINPETGESSQTRSPRFSMWVALVVFSVITMGASVELKNDQDDDKELGVTSKVRWAVACSIVSVAFGGLVLIGHLIPLATTFVVGTFVEGITAILLMIFWGCTVAVVTDSDDMGIDPTAQGVVNANLYYFSWACFLTSVIMAVNYLRERFGLDLAGEISNRGARLNLWAALIATTLVVAGSSGRSLEQYCNGGTDEAVQPPEFCPRTKFGIATGTIGLFLALAVVAMKTCRQSTPIGVELMCAIVAAIINGFCVAFVTSNKGPASSIGNLYYFSWGSFLISALLTAECFGQQRNPAGGNDGNKDESNGDVEVQDLDNYNGD